MVTLAAMTQKNAVVTGATGGIGRKIVEDLSRDHTVYALGRNPEKLAELAGLGNVRAIETDLVSELLDEVPVGELRRVQELARVDVVIHAAAIAQRHEVEFSRPMDWRRHFEINVFAPAELSRQLMSALHRADGLVVFINSGAGVGAHPGNTIYAASKHALYGLSDGMRKEQAANGVRVCTVAPGPTDTPMLQGLNAAAGSQYFPEHYIDPVEVARAVRLAVDAGPSTQITDVAVRPRIELADRA